MDGAVVIRNVPEGESGVVVGRLTEPVLQSLVSFWSLPRSVRHARYGSADVAVLAARLGVTPGFLRKSERNPRALAAIRQELIAASTHLMADVVWGQFQKAIARQDTAAAEWCRKFVGWAEHEGGGAEVNVRVGVHVQAQVRERSIEEDMGNLAYLKELRDSGGIDRLVAVLDSTVRSGR